MEKAERIVSRRGNLVREMWLQVLTPQICINRKRIRMYL